MATLLLYVPCSKSATNTLPRIHKTQIFFFHACQKGGPLYYGCLHWTLCLPVILLLAYCCYFQTCHALAISRLYKTHARLSKEKNEEGFSHNNKLVKQFHSWPSNNNKNQQEGWRRGGRWICPPHMTDPHPHILWAQYYWTFMHIVVHASVVECILRYIGFQCCNVSYWADFVAFLQRRINLLFALIW